jgi:hypothetical protein
VRWALGAALVVLAAAAVIGVVLIRAPSGETEVGVVATLHRGTTCGSTYVMRVDPLTLERRGNRSLRLSGSFAEPVSSPNGQRVALAGSAGSIVIAQLGSMRRSDAIRVGGPFVTTGVLAWPVPNRLVAEAFLADAHRIGTHRLVVVDPPRRRVLHQLHVDQWWSTGNGRTDGGRVAVLIASSIRLGHPRLLVVGVDGEIRTVNLTRMRAGLGYSSEGEVGRFPGLAVDPTGERAFVVDEGEPVAIVDLRTLAVRYRRVPGLVIPPRSLAGPARRTGTANPRRGPNRTAQWLGAGLVAISGFDGYTAPAGRFVGESDAPAGIQILDTRTWHVRTLDPRPTSFEWLGGRLVAYARAWDPRARAVRGDALVAFDRTGRVRFRVPGKGYWQSFAGRIFLEDSHSRLMNVLDPRDGHRLGKVSQDRLFALDSGYC